MAFFSCKCKSNCTLVAFVASLLIGVVTAFLRITATIEITPAFLWALFGIGVGFLAIGVATPCCDRCADVDVASPLSALLFGALGTVLFSVILLAGEFVATSVVGAIFAGLLLFSFSFLLGSAACLTRARCDS